MKTDRELLELAAKAAGMPPDGTEGGPMSKGGLVWSVDGDCIDWNPIADDGDALRLANKLRISIQRETLISAPFPASVNCGQYGVGRPDWAEEPEGDDANAATRLAITRAAAAIGEAIP